MKGYWITGRLNVCCPFCGEYENAEFAGNKCSYCGAELEMPKHVRTENNDDFDKLLEI